MSATLQSPGSGNRLCDFTGLISLAGALCTAEMCSLFPNSGGKYFIFQKVYNRFFAFIYGWANLAVVKTASIAASAYIFAQSLNSILPLPLILLFSIGSHFICWKISRVKLLASSLIILLSYINYRGIKHAQKSGNFMTVLMLSAAALIIIGGFSSSSGDLVHLKTATMAGAGLSGWSLVKAIIIASLGAFWGYEGWNCVGFIGEEVKNPKKNIPLALGIGTLVIMLVYVLLNTVYLYILPIGDFIKINDSHNQIAAVNVMRVVWGKPGQLFVAILILVTTFNATNATILTSPGFFMPWPVIKYFCRWRQQFIRYTKHLPFPSFCRLPGLSSLCGPVHLTN